MIALTCFATPAFVGGQRALAQSALQGGVDRVVEWRADDLRRTSFYEEHRDILGRPKGAGCWLWKPYIILRGLEDLKDGDLLIYHDCGKPEKPYGIPSSLNVLIRWCRDEAGGMLPGVYIPQHGANRRWTKGECFRVMGCEDEIFKNHPQVQATFSIWRKQEASLDFICEWLRWCTVPAALIDDRIDPSIPDAPDFREHRHDQSILTLLTLKRGLKCYGEPWEAAGDPKCIKRLIDRIKGRIETQSFEPES